MISLEEVNKKWHIIFRFDFDPPKVRSIKQLPNAQYWPDLKGWAVPYSPLAAWLCKRFFSGEENYRDPILDYPRYFSSWKDRSGFDTYQNEGVRFLQRAGDALLYDEPGIGKTRQAIGAMADYLPCLILCPSSVVYSWKHEIKQIAKDPRITIDFPFAAEHNGWTIISHDQAIRFHKKLTNVGFVSCIIDESHKLRNPDTKKTRAIISIATRIPRTLCVSGTPIVNRIPDLITSLVATKKMSLNDWSWFLLRYADGKKNRRGRLVGNEVSRSEELKEFLSSFLLRRTREDVDTGIPPCSHKVLEVEIPRYNYDKEESQVRTWLQTFGAIPRYRSQKMIKYNLLRLQLSIDKIKPMQAILAERRRRKQKTVVISSFLSPITFLEQPGDAVIVGKSTKKQRDAAMRRFQTDPKCLTAFCSTEAGGIGVTLTAADTLYILDFPWTPISLQQSAARINRRTQARPTTIYYVTARNTIDEAMVAVLQKKARVISKALDKEASQEDVLNTVDQYFRR